MTFSCFKNDIKVKKGKDVNKVDLYNNVVHSTLHELQTFIYFHKYLKKIII